MMRTSHFTGRRLVGLLGLGVALSGCFLLSPDDERHLELRLIAALPSEDASIAAAAFRPGATRLRVRGSECACPEELFVSDTLSARGTVTLQVRSRDGTLEEERVIAQAPLVVGPYDSVSGTRVLTGDLTFSPGGASDTYEIRAELLYTGRLLDGFYIGDIGLDSGLAVEVDTFLVAGSSAYIAVSFDSVFASHDFDIPEFNPDKNQYAYSYADSITFQGQRREITGSLTFGFEPVAIYVGSVITGLLGPGSGMIERDVILQKSTGSPGYPGDERERLTGSVWVGFTDHLAPLSETGYVELERNIKACDCPVTSSESTPTTAAPSTRFRISTRHRSRAHARSVARTRNTPYPEVLDCVLCKLRQR